MRGRANDPVGRRAKASRHAKRAHYCSCGKVAFGNGGWASHVAMHIRRNEWRQRDDHGETDAKFTMLSAEQHRAKFPEQYATTATMPELAEVGRQDRKTEDVA